jgi:hypothetical protein
VTGTGNFVLGQTFQHLFHLLGLLLLGPLLDLLLHEVQEPGVEDDKVSLVVLLPLGHHAAELPLRPRQLLLQLLTELQLLLELPTSVVEPVGVVGLPLYTEGE